MIDFLWVMFTAILVCGSFWAGTQFESFLDRFKF